MNRLTTFLAFVIIAAAVGGLLYLGSRASQVNQDRVGVTVNPLLDLVEQVAGDDVAVQLIAPEGANPHTFEPRVSEIQKIERSRVIFAVGQGFDDWITAPAQQASDRPVITLDQQVSLLPNLDAHNDEPLEQEASGSQGTTAGDPHYWLSPSNAGQMVLQVAATLSEYWPEHRDAFFARANAYRTRLEEVTNSYAPRFAATTPQIATFHNAFAYLARDFNFQIVTTFEKFAGQSPTPEWLVEFQQRVKKHELRTVFSEPDFPTTALEPVAKDLGLEIKELDPLESSRRHTTYLDALTDNLDAILAE